MLSTGKQIYLKITLTSYSWRSVQNVNGKTVQKYGQNGSSRGSVSQITKIHLKLRRAVFHCHFSCDIILCSAINTDMQLRSMLTLWEIGPWAFHFQRANPKYEKIPYNSRATVALLLLDSKQRKLVLNFEVVLLLLLLLKLLVLLLLLLSLLLLLLF